MRKIVLLGAMAAFVSGRVTHQLMAGFWPTADQDPDTPPVMAEFAGIWRDKPKYVFSRTLASAEWNTTVLPGVVPEQIAELKAQPGGDLVLGGADLHAAGPGGRIPALHPPRGGGGGATEWSCSTTGAERSAAVRHQGKRPTSAGSVVVPSPSVGEPFMPCACPLRGLP